MAQETKTGALYQPRGWDGEGDGREVQKEGIYVYLWLIHVEAWQKTTKFCKATILQQKINLKIKYFLKIIITEKKTVLSDLTYMWNPSIKELLEAENRLTVARGRG